MAADTTDVLAANTTDVWAADKYDCGFQRGRPPALFPAASLLSRRSPQALRASSVWVFTTLQKNLSPLVVRTEPGHAYTFWIRIEEPKLVQIEPKPDDVPSVPVPSSTHFIL